MNFNLSISQTSFKDLFIVEELSEEVINLEFPVNVVIRDNIVEEQIYLN
jgi:hypothetical protein